MGALTRVLSEEYKKSVELCYNILRAFLVRGGGVGGEGGRPCPAFVISGGFELGGFATFPPLRACL